MEKKLNFRIKKGVYCSWCADLMRKTLNQHFALKKIKIDVLKAKVHIMTHKKVSPKSVMVFLKKRGYGLVEER